MEHDDLVIVRHMLDLANSVVERASRVERSEFDADQDLRDLLAFYVQRIGEAARGVSIAFRESHSTIPWQRAIAHTPPHCS